VKAGIHCLKRDRKAIGAVSVEMNGKRGQGNERTRKQIIVAIYLAT